MPNFRGNEDLRKLGKEYLNVLICKFCRLFSTAFWNFWRITRLSTTNPRCVSNAQTGPVFWPTLYIAPFRHNSTYRPLWSSKVDDFHLIWKNVCHLLLVTKINLTPISHSFRDEVTYSLKLSTKNCGRTAADGDMVTIGSL